MSELEKNIDILLEFFPHPISGGVPEKEFENLAQQIKDAINEAEQVKLQNIGDENDDEEDEGSDDKKSAKNSKRTKYNPLNIEIPTSLKNFYLKTNGCGNGVSRKNYTTGSKKYNRGMAEIYPLEYVLEYANHDFCRDEFDGNPEDAPEEWFITSYSWLFFAADGEYHNFFVQCDTKSPQYGYVASSVTDDNLHEVVAHSVEDFIAVFAMGTKHNITWTDVDKYLKAYSIDKIPENEIEFEEREGSEGDDDDNDKGDDDEKGEDEDDKDDDEKDDDDEEDKEKDEDEDEDDGKDE